MTGESMGNERERARRGRDIGREIERESRDVGRDNGDSREKETPVGPR